MRQSFLKMSNSKTEIVIFGTHSQCNKITTTGMEVSQTSLNISSELNYLGVLLDQNLTLKTHILTKAKRASYHLYRIRQIAKFLDPPATKHLFHPWLCPSWITPMPSSLTYQTFPYTSCNELKIKQPSS